MMWGIFFALVSCNFRSTVCLSFNDAGSFSPLCSLYSVPLSLSSALSGPLVYTGVYILILEEAPPLGEGTRICTGALKELFPHEGASTEDKGQGY